MSAHTPFSRLDFTLPLAAGEITKGDAMIIRYQGPSGAPGMPEMLAVSGALVGAGLGSEVPLITDGRFSGA